MQTRAKSNRGNNVPPPRATSLAGASVQPPRAQPPPPPPTPKNDADADAEHFLDNESNAELLVLIVQATVGEVPAESYKKSKRRTELATLGRVSTAFARAASTVTYASAAPVISGPDVVALKRRAFALNLRDGAPGLHATFLRDVKSTFAHKVVCEDFGLDEAESDDEDALPWYPTFVKHFFDGSEEKLARAAESEYKKLLVLKGIEALAKDKQRGLDTSWGTRCQPTTIIDLFWHAHMLHPRAYQSACDTLIGRTIDHEPSYTIADSLVAGVGEKAPQARAEAVRPRPLARSHPSTLP